jgi:shikimate kinase/3-dehydroquinate synthase
MAPLARALVFIGFMGAGKTAAALEVASALGGQALDSDSLLEARMGRTVAEEFERSGEDAFRAQEEELVCELLARADAGVAISLGGGSVLSERVRRALEPHLTVMLDVDVEVAWARVHAVASRGAGEGGEKSRPLARDRDAFAELYGERKGLYEDLADAILPAGRHLVLGDLEHDTPPAAVGALPALRALAVTQASAGERRAARLLWGASASGEYPVLVGRGLLGADAPAEVWQLGAPSAADRAAVGRAFCVTDEHVAALYAPPLPAPHPPIAIQPGEAHKTLASAERVWRELAAAGMTRADRLIALGGGVVGDLAGFCAATYQRGVPVVQVPTTLAAQVDSAYGGKTGVDIPEAKNYVGVYHQPAAVIVDPDALRTLPAAELSAGWVEALKTALIAGGELWQRLAADEPVDERTILACARLKLAVVAADERDAGRRQVLNLGHTVGHAIETATGYARYRHGEAVGLGLLAALRLSGQDALRAQIRELLLAHELPVTLAPAGGRTRGEPGATGAGAGRGDRVDVEAVLAAVAHDKKRVGERVPFVLLDAPGDVRVGCEVAPAELRAAVAELAPAAGRPHRSAR